MLKRLELAGFKSFADHTELCFSDGVTAVVGPNGSGKSNVVDAVRWVLGEQSAKSLRSGGMSEVIFNGSTSRKSLGMAEVTMTFDNSKQALATDALEVQITRRVYRSGESEYLINKQIARLKDIKDLFLGSGAGTNAYSIIEQGRVDGFLQASAKERRNVFEEAAGISRFKVKKIETLRKLERVDQNVQRLKDILDEVDKQLRSVRLQAAKAQRYQEYTARLRELRIAIGLQEYHVLATMLEEASASLSSLRSGLDEEMEQAQEWEQELYQLEESLTHLEEAIEEQESLLGTAQQQITANRSTWSHEQSLTEEILADLSRERIQSSQLTRRLATLNRAICEASAQLADVEEQVAEGQQGVSGLEQEVTQLAQQIEMLQEQAETDKATHLELMRQSGQLQNDVISYRADMENLQRARERLRHRSDQAADNLASVEKHLEELSTAEEELQQRLTQARQRKEEHRKTREHLEQLREETAQKAAELRAQRTGLTSRIEVLEGLERSHEGLSTGVREVFELMEQPDTGPWSTVRGIIADFLSVRREFAPLIDLALGEKAQHFVVNDVEQLRRALESRDTTFSGRVSFFPLRQPSIPTAEIITPSHPGVVALAEQVVTCENVDLADLPRRLLARTLIVHDLESARLIRVESPQLRFITLRGELLEPDGTVTVGTHHAESGILSRKSELRELRSEVATLDRRIHEIEQDIRGLRSRIAESEALLEQSGQEIDVLTEQATDLKSRLIQHQERRDGLHEEVVLSQTEISGLEDEIASLTTALEEAKSQAEHAEQQVQELYQRIVDAEREARQKEQQRADQLEASAEARAQLAQIEERRTSLQATVLKLENDQEQREQEVSQHQSRLLDLEERLLESQLALLDASSSLAKACSHKESAEEVLQSSHSKRSAQRRRKQQLSEQAQSQRATWQERQSQAHQQELQVRDLDHRLSNLLGRLSEDYDLDLTVIYRIVYGLEDVATAEPVTPVLECRHQNHRELPRIEGILPFGEKSKVVPSHEITALPTLEFVETLDPEEAQQEIEELRKKLNRLGSVNLESLEELNEQEMRAHALQLQYDDLTSAKRSLEDIIEKINTDSKELFKTTFADIRAHFQELFRKLFGGGQADIILEDEDDILDCGIEIIARPPGKELRSISQMSGGERTMTAVALLLSVFRSKPSPFCILDEVDAALDEANVGRLSSVLREFLTLSQFIMITHHKRTMAAADVLVGVTMQEPGVSKLMTVRFEDWSEEQKAA